MKNFIMNYINEGEYVGIWDLMAGPDGKSHSTTKAEREDIKCSVEEMIIDGQLSLYRSGWPSSDIEIISMEEAIKLLRSECTWKVPNEETKELFWVYHPE